MKYKFNVGDVVKNSWKEYTIARQGSVYTAKPAYTYTNGLWDFENCLTLVKAAQSPESVLDLSKPVQTQDGRSVRILCTDGPGQYPVIGFAGDEMMVKAWSLSGKFNKNDTDPKLMDLVNVPEKPVSAKATWDVYLNESPAGKVYLSIQPATKYSPKGKVLGKIRVPITITEGEGL